LGLWYQPKFNARTLQLSGVEALIRVRHPTWGLVPPAYFMPDLDDPCLNALSNFVVNQAIEDWHYFTTQQRAVQIAVNLPLDFFRNPDSITNLCRRLPNHAVDSQFVTGCSDDRLKRTACRQILDIADGFGCRTVAQGVESRADFFAIREMDFDMVQGFLFAKPMTAQKFALTNLRQPVS
jgi:EAL domain-containing protein (putative c-di-GMP-specific phosphodiesterase class I)